MDTHFYELAETLKNCSASTLIQHVSQLNFLLTSVPKADDRPKNQIGFAVPEV